VGCEGRLALRYPMCTEGFDAVVCRDGAPLIAGRCGSSAGGSARVLVGDRERWRLVASGPEKASRAGTARRCARPGNACRFRLNSEQPVPGWVLVNVATGRIFDRRHHLALVRPAVFWSPEVLNASRRSGSDRGQSPGHRTSLSVSLVVSVGPGTRGDAAERMPYRKRAKGTRAAPS
jgi:hypothetical protein